MVVWGSLIEIFDGAALHVAGVAGVELTGPIEREQLPAPHFPPLLGDCAWRK